MVSEALQTNNAAPTGGNGRSEKPSEPIVSGIGNVPQLLSEARARHRKAEFAKAEELYVSILEVDSNNIEVLTLLGTLHAQRGRFEDAKRFLDQSLATEGRQPFALNSLGNVLNSLGRHGEALAAFDKTLAIDRNHAAAHNNRGTALRGLRRPQEALASIDKAIIANPAYAEAFHNRGLALCDLRRREDALRSYDRAIALKPEFPDAHRNRGNALRDLRRFAEALDSYDKAIALDPGFAECHFDKGLALEESGRRAEALASYNRALALKSDRPAAHNSAGSLLLAAHRHAEALVHYEEAIALKPDYAEAYNNLAVAFQELRRRSDSLVAYDEAIALNPDLAVAHHGRGKLLMDMRRHTDALASFGKALDLEPNYAEAHCDRALALVDLGRHSEALVSFDKALACNPELPGVHGSRWSARLSICDWNELEKEAQELRFAVGRGLPVSTPVSFMTVPCGPDLQRRCAEAFVRRFSLLPVAPARDAEIRAHGRIRVAYLSADFRTHATSFLAVGLFEQHDRDKFEVYGISYGWDDRSPMRARVKDGFEHFIDVRDMSDQGVTALLRELRIDIAVDLMGFTKQGRLGILASRPAPIQVNYLGNPGTTGADYFDYIIADWVVIPEDGRRCYSENVVYMPDTYQCNDSKRVMGRSPSRGAAGLPDDGFVFCSFNQTAKITPAIFDVWMRLLHRKDDSVLWLLQSNPTAARNLRHHAEARGIAPERLIFAPPVSNSDHLARHSLADLFLDTLPYGAHTTASDALWAGLPVLTCKGETFPGRVAASLLGAIGLPELVTHSPAGYEARALELAGDPDALAAIRAKLQRNRETYPLFDTVRFTRNLEAAYMRMVELHRSGNPPASFAVEAARPS